MIDEKERYEKILKSLEKAKFPIATEEELFKALHTSEEIHCRKKSAEKNRTCWAKFLSEDDFPFTSAEIVASTIVEKTEN